MQHYQILPSILSADMTRLGEEVEAVMKAGGNRIHFDVMDNHYVPNLTFGPIICEKLHQRFADIPIDVHLMVSPVDNLIEQFAKVGANRISIHPDATIHLDRSLQLIKEKGCLAGIALNPSTGPECIRWCKQYLDFVLVMTVNPGFGGQQLIPEMTQKIAIIHEQYPDLTICVDGGINPDNIAYIASAGATEFVIGSALFRSADYAATIAKLRQQLTHTK